MNVCSLLSPSTFEGAHGNLVRLLERARRRFHELNDQPTSQKGLSLDQQMYALYLVLFKQCLDICGLCGREAPTKIQYAVHEAAYVNIFLLYVRVNVKYQLISRMPFRQARDELHSKLDVSVAVWTYNHVTQFQN